MKKIGVLLLCLLMAIFLFGCSQSNESKVYFDDLKKQGENLYGDQKKNWENVVKDLETAYKEAKTISIKGDDLSKHVLRYSEKIGSQYQNVTPLKLRAEIISSKNESYSYDWGSAEYIEYTAKQIDPNSGEGRVLYF